ncbi:TRAP transporter large permease [Jiangella asiatica]|uniref:TRAP transporter large permease n=1 Tax=Jiangella asiatica TaxID=2530372 RepID=A0A4R5DX33_9ACTN|nr:TRAP transporter large permease [Jiangella asiatica]TDE15875.1 TRAP transporter large permease [Jiangella asiatica]
MDIIWLLVPMIALIFARVPVAYAIGISAVAFSLLQGSNVAAVVQRSVAALDSFTLLAIPLFLLAAEIMNAAGLTRVLMDAVLSWVRNLRGGLAYANVGASMVFAGISGAAVADAAGTGRLLIPQMTRNGYSPRYAASVTASSSLISPILPPSIPLIVYGLIAQVSIGALFMAGILPAFLMAGALLLVVFATTSRDRSLPREPFSASFAARATGKALPILLLPIVIIGGLRFGYFTPTEAAAIAVGYALVCTLFYVRLPARVLGQVLQRAALTSASILIIIAFAAHVGWIMSVRGIPRSIAETLSSMTSSPQVLLLIVMVFLLVIGTFMEAIAAMLIVVPVLAPAATELGIDPVHFGVVIVMTLMLGLLTPPVGLVLYVVGEAAGLDAMKVARANVAFFLALLAATLLVALVPELALWLPGLSL